MKRLGILLSGRGSNFLAIADAIEKHRLLGAEISVVLSNREDAPGLASARELGLPAFCIPSASRNRVEHDTEMIARLHQHHVDLVCLAGYMRIISPQFIAAFPGRILNVHPSLLPAFPGLDAQKQALDYGVKIAGCTVHFVNEAVDDGAIILQRVVPVHDEDTAAALSARILVQEHLAYPEAIARVLSGEMRMRDRRYVHHKHVDVHRQH
ncbi:MAG: phosphoribosylglycinamide formyltransferase [Granulicella sp.]